MNYLSLFLILIAAYSQAQVNPLNSPAQTQTQLKVNELIAKKAEYHRLTNGVIDGYRIKIHFGVEREAAENVKQKFSTKFPEIAADLEYEQPHFVILVGHYRTKLEAFESYKKIKIEFPDAFIVNGKITIQ